MSTPIPIHISGTGSYLPECVVTNHDLSKQLDTSDEWIRQRVGIIERHIASATESTCFMATRAAERALAAAGLTAQDIGLIVVGTSTPDDLLPSSAGQVQAALGTTDCIAFDLNAACSGFVYALTVAQQFLLSGSVKHALVIGSERMSRTVDWQDRRTCVLFGDGAGAVVLSAGEREGLLGAYLHSAGSCRDLLFAPSALSPAPFKAMTDHSPLVMDGGKVFKCAVNMLGEVVEEVLQKHHLSKNQIDWLVPHQANERIITATADKLAMTMDKVVLTLPYHGNTSSASIPLALDTAVRDGRIQPGQLLLLEAFGAGFAWGAALVRW